MVSASDFTQICNTTITETSQCTPETCCLAQGQMRYIPTLVGNTLFTAIFGVLIIPHAIIVMRYKTWSFFAWMTLGLTGEIVGYVGRIMLHDNIFSFDAFLIYLILLTIAPAFITASIYLCLARLIHILDPNLSRTRLKPMTYTKIFVTFDIISLILQATGGGIAASADSDKSTSDLGVDIMIAGLAFQVFSLLVFVGLCSDFAFRLYRGPVSGRKDSNANTDASYDTRQGITNQSSLMPPYEEAGPNTPDYETIKRSKMFKGFIGALAAATILILIRSTYRLAELQDGFEGELANDETVFMIFEGPMIILSCIGLTIFHPGLALKGLWSAKDFQSRAAGLQDDLRMTSISNSKSESQEN